MLKCNRCKTEYVYKLFFRNGEWICKRCRPALVLPDAAILGQTVALETGHRRICIPRTEYDEIHRNVLLPGSTNEKRYMGRRMENGRIAEHEIKPY